MLERRSLIFVYLGNVGGSNLWLTNAENPIIFGESPFNSGWVPFSIVFFIVGISSVAPFNNRTISAISVSFGETCYEINKLYYIGFGHNNYIKLKLP